MSDPTTTGDDLTLRVQARIGEQTRTGLHGDAQLIADLFDALVDAEVEIKRLRAENMRLQFVAGYYLPDADDTWDVGDYEEGPHKVSAVEIVYDEISQGWWETLPHDEWTDHELDRENEAMGRLLDSLMEAPDE